MINKELQNLVSSIEKIEIGIDELTDQLNMSLSRFDKTYSINFRKKQYDFIPPTTIEERHEAFMLRRKFIKSLLKHVISKNITNNKYGWDDITSFATGADPRDFQFEKLTEIELTPQLDEHGEKIQHIPLNQDSYYVKCQDARDDKQDQEMAQ